MTLNLKTLAVTAFSATGAALAGPGGALVGNLVGGLVATVLPGISGVTGEVAGQLAGRLISSGSKSLASKLEPGEAVRINHDLQAAFRQAFELALVEVGGEQTFLEDWKRSPRQPTPGDNFFATSTGSVLWRNQDPLASQVADCLTALRQALKSGKVLPLEPPGTTPAAQAELYLQAGTPGDLAGAFYDQVLAPFLSGYASLTREVPDFELHLRRVLLDRTLAHLGEILKKQPQAWRAYSRLALEEIRDQLRQAETGQEEILARLDLILDRPGGQVMSGLASDLASLLSAAGETEKRLDESLDAVLARVVSQHRQTLQRLDSLLSRQKRVEKKVDRVLRILEDGRYVIEGTSEVVVDRPPTPGESPFKGLQFFEEADADLFFGRENLTLRLVSQLSAILENAFTPGTGAARPVPCFLAIIGASGSGKSSLVRAGLIPALRNSKPLADGSHPPGAGTGWCIHLLTPTASPLDSLARALLPEAAGPDRRSLAEELAAGPRVLRDWFVSQAEDLKGQSDEPCRSHLIVVDQFEELFSLCRKPEIRQAFIENLMGAAAPGEEDLHLIVVITLRADFYAQCGEYEALRQALERQQVFIGPMSRDELRSAIEGPAHAGGWSFERGLVDLIIRDVGDEPGALPLLSHALLETWKHRRGTVMTLESYAESGGVRGAIARTAETVFHQRLSPDQQQIARNIFMRLTEPGEVSGENTDTRRRAEISELIPDVQSAQGVERVLKILADARLVTTSRESAEVAHEALIREWPTLRKWLDENRAGLRLHRQLTEAAQEWARMGRDPGGLYRGLRLNQALEWAASPTDQLTSLESEYLDASEAAAEQAAAEVERQRQFELDTARRLADEASARQQAEAERRGQAERSAAQLRTRNRIITTIGVVAAAAALSAGFFGYKAQINAAASQASLQTAEAASTRAIQEADTRATAEGIAVAQRSTADASSQEALRQSRISRARELAAQAASLTPRSQDIGLLLAIQAVQTAAEVPGASIPEGRTALLGALQNANYSRTLRGHQARVHLAVFSPAGSPGDERILTASMDGTASLWDLEGSLLAVLEGHEDQVLFAQFSPDGRTIATASADSTARLWDLDGNQLAVFSGHTDWVNTIAFSPDGNSLVTASSDGTARIWSIDGSLKAVLEGHTSLVTAAGYSPDGAYILTTSVDNTARLWRSDGTLAAVLQGHTGWPAFFQFSPDSTRILTAGWDGKAILWDTSGAQQVTLAGHTRSVNTAVFSPDGTKILTASYDNTARLWDLQGNQLAEFLGHTGPVTLALFSPDGQSVLTSSNDYTARLWSIYGEQLAVLRGHTDWVNSAVFSPDGRWIVTASDDGTARLWEVGALVREVLSGHTGVVSHAAFSPDGSLLATGGAEGNILLWTASGRLENVLGGRDGPANSVQFSRDGKRLLGAFYTNKAQIWNLDGSLVQKFEGAADVISWAVFSDDEQWVAASSWDGKARLYHIGGSLAAELAGHTDLVNMVNFQPGGDLLVTASSDLTARLWKRDGTQVAVLSGHEAPVRSAVFSPDGTKVLTASWDRTARIWDLQGNLLMTLTGHPEWLSMAVYSPDGNLIATGSTDGSIRLWTTDGSFLAALDGHRAAVTSLTFSPDQKRLVSTSMDGTARTWVIFPDEQAMLAAARQRVGRTLTNAECLRYLYLDACPAEP